jgi:Zn-finger nucleic acid-binding protein
MIIDCPKCHLHYDVSKYKPGQRLRCRCGQILEVPSGAREQAAPTLHCNNCGGNLEKGEAKCSYCGAMVDLRSARMTAYCTSCLATSREGAKFCSGCGKPITEKLDVPSETDAHCPRCNVRMRSRTIGTHKTDECPVCLGIFVNVDHFETLIRRQEDRVGEVPAARGPKRASLQVETVSYIKCPECGRMMNRLNYGRISGVIVDYCSEHGYWLDDGELEKIAMWVATGGLAKKYEIEKDEARAAARKAQFDRMLEANRGSTYGDQPRGGVRMGGVRFGGDSGGLGMLDLVSKLFD